MPYKDPQKAAERLRKIRADNPGYSTAKNRAHQDKYPEKRRAHKWVSNHLRYGTLTKKPCEECGELDVEAHHEDYSKPSEVNWLCRKHHVARHMAIARQTISESPYDRAAMPGRRQ